MSDPSEISKPAGWEHLFQSGTFPPRYRAMADPNPSVVEWAGVLPPYASVLDVGCGIGRHTLYLGKHGFKMSGTDISPYGVAQTRKACEEAHIPFDGRVADMTALPWENQSFDAVLSTSTICHHRIGAMRQTIAEVWRVLNPGGAFLVDFLHKGTQSYQRILEQATAGQLSEVEPDTFVDERAEPDLHDDAFLPHHYCDEDEVRSLLKAFDIVNIWTDLPAPSATGDLPQRGHWVASVRKPLVTLQTR